MIDIRELRRDSAGLLSKLARKGAHEVGREFLAADTAWRESTTKVEGLRASLKRSDKPTEERVRELAARKEALHVAQQELAVLERTRQDLLDRLPNPPADDVPDGGEDDYTVVREVGARPSFAFPVKNHSELAEGPGWVDAARGTKVSGSRFVYRVGHLALVELALYRFALQRIVDLGHVPVLPPVLVRRKAMYGTGFLPNDAINIYELERDGLYLVGTSEVPLAAFHAGETMDELPRRYVAQSTCFRRESGAAGKDTRGMFRVHQFEKVEMFVCCLPEHSREEHDRLLAIEEEIVQTLGLPYRVINTAAADLGAPAAKKYDIEAWFPAEQRYREITSTSNTTDFQARRLDIRFRRDGKREPIHMLNGTAVTARSLLAILENFQQADGSVVIPPVLHAFGAPRLLGPRFDI